MAASLTEEELRELERLEALEARVTPTPWRAGNVDLDCIFVEATHADRMAHERVLLRMNQHFNGYDLDAQFIAAMRNALPALLASARAVRNASVAVEQAIAVLDSVPPHSFIRDSYYDSATSALLDARRALTATAEPTAGEDEAPYVCPGCHAVAEPCAPGCIDASMEAERREAIESGDYDDSEDYR